jgi:hypothetical protein
MFALLISRMLADYTSFFYKILLSENAMKRIAEAIENRLQKAIFEIQSGDLHGALVRLWAISGLRMKSTENEDSDLVLNIWERNTRPERRQEYTEQFVQKLSSGKNIPIALVTAEPLALIQALDSFLANQRAPRRKSSVAYSIDGIEYWLVRIPLGPRASAPLSHQANNRAGWFIHHNVIPALLLGRLNTTIKIRIVEPDLATQGRIAELRGTSKIRVYLVHFTDKVELKCTLNPAKKFFADGLSASDIRISSIRAHLKYAYNKDADIIIFPELTVTPEQRREIRIWHLNKLDKQEHVPIFIVAGSFHEITEDGRKVNRAEMLGASGKQLLFHNKIRPFGFADGRAEDIDSGNCINLLSTAIGIIAMPICKDFNDAAGIDWTEIGPDWCLVPSMGDESNISAHSEQAQKLWKIFFRTISLIANQEFEGDPAPGFVFSKGRMPMLKGGGIIEVPI